MLPLGEPNAQFSSGQGVRNASASVSAGKAKPSRVPRSACGEMTVQSSVDATPLRCTRPQPCSAIAHKHAHAMCAALPGSCLADAHD